MSEPARKVLFILALFVAFYFVWRGLDGWRPGLKSGVGGPALPRSELLRADQSGRLLAFVAGKVAPSVVFIRAESVREERSPWGPPMRLRSEAVGSGIVITRKGHIATNAHLVRGALRLTVILADRREFQARVTGLDSASDIALIQIRASRITPARLGDSDSLEPGAWVLAVGNPLGLSHSVTFGIVSAVGRENPVASEDAADYIQTDASVNPGNSGGPLVNLDGEVVGMNSFIISPTGESAGAGFAVPVNLLRFVTESLVRDGRVVRGWLGVELQEINSGLVDALKLKSPGGALISRVVPGSPAEKAGIKAGDVALAFGRRPIRNPHDLRSEAARQRPGRKLLLRIFRDGGERKVEVEIGRREGETVEASGKIKERKGQAYKSRKLGLTVVPLPEGFPEGAEGVLVRESSLDQNVAANPRPGDRVLKINDREMKSLADFKNADRALDRGEETLLLLARDGALFYTSVRTR